MSGVQLSQEEDPLADFRDDPNRARNLETVTDALPGADETEEEAPVTGERPLSARERVMQQAVARREEVRLGELAQSEIYDTEARENGMVFRNEEDEPPEPAIPPVTRAEPVVAPAPVAEPVHQAVPPVPPQVRTVTWDGQQYAVTDEQFTQLAQLGMVANVAMHGYQAPQPAPVPEPPAPKPLIDDDRLAETVKQMQYGGPEEAARALREFVTDVVTRAPQPQQIDPNALVARAVAETEGRITGAQHKQIIQSEFADIFENPQRVALANMNVQAIERRNQITGQRQSHLEIYREAGRAVRDAMALPAPAIREEAAPVVPQSNNVVSMRDEVIERKRNAPRPTQAVDMRAPTPTQQQAPRLSEIVDQMRAARGQPSAR